MEVMEIAVEKIRPNPWNPNLMSAEIRRKLARYIQREGLVAPLVVRPHPKVKGEYELIGGEHRWRICKEELGFRTVPCVVVNLDDKRAKILGVNLNSMTGQPVPSRLAELLNDLHMEMPMPDLEATLPYDTRQIQDVLSLMQLPEGLGDQLEDEAAVQDRAAPNAVTIVFDKQQLAVFEEALAVAKEEIGAVREPKARAVTRMAEVYLERRQAVGPRSK